MTPCVACWGPLTAHDVATRCIRCGACRFNGNGVRKGQEPAERAKVWPWGWNPRTPQPTGPVTWWIGLGRAEFAAEVRARFEIPAQGSQKPRQDAPGAPK